MNSRPFHAGLSCFFLVLGGAAATAEEPAAKPPEVLVARPVVREITDHEDFTGRTEASTRVDLRARVTGYLLKAAFQDGAEVKEGDVLFEIDPRPYYRAELDRTEAALTVAEARLKLAEANSKRAAALFGQKVLAQEELDKAVAERTEAEAALRLARAVREAARLNLEYTRVVAPISGQIGRRLVDPGNLVKADETILAVLVSRDPMYAYFDVDERTLLRLRRALLDGKLKGEKLPVAIGLAGEEGFPHRSVVDFADNRVDPTTGTLRLRAVLPNKDRLLSPGLFVRVRLAVSEPHKALLVPAQAVMLQDGARFVFVVNDKDVIEKRPVVVLGQESDGQRVVASGLKGEDRVVIGRLEGLRPGMAVRPKEGGVPVPKPGIPNSSGVRQEGRVGETGPGILVTADYPGANAQVVADAVAAPIEQQVRDMEKLLYLRSRCARGQYTLAATFARDVDLWRAQVLVQNRVALAVPVLPEAVQLSGVKVTRGVSGVLLIVNLFSPDGRYDELYLGNYANILLRDALAELPGAGAVTLLGHGDYGLRLSLDPEKLAARNRNAGEVVRLLEKQKETPDLDLEKLSDLILKADGEGRVVRLKDVVAVALSAVRQQGTAFLDGKPSMALVIHPTGEVRPQKLRAALREKLAELRARLPEGLALDATFDFTANWEAPDRPTTPEYLLLDLSLPDGASAERLEQLRRRCEALVQQQPGVQHVLALSTNPFDLFARSPCLLVLLSPAEQRKPRREEVIRTLRTRLAEIEEVTVRLRDLSGLASFPHCAYPVDLALHGPELDRVREWARKLVERLARSKKLTDVWANSDAAPRLQRTVDVDRDAARARGVSLEDVFNTLQVYQGAVPVGSINRFGRIWRVEVQAEAGSGDWAKDVQQLKVRNGRGQMIPLGAFVTVRESAGPLALDFLNSQPMVEITANPESGVSAEQAQLCETLAAEVSKELQLSGEYRLTWLHELPRSK